MKWSKKDKSLSKVIITSIMVVMFFFSIVQIHSSTFGNVPVSYRKEIAEAYPLIVDVAGEGSVFEGNTIIRNSERNYILENGESISFDIIPDRGAELVEATLEGKDIIPQIQGNTFTVVGNGKGKVMRIRFQSTQEEGDAIVPPQTNGPNTGDQTELMKGLVMLASSMGLLILLVIWKKEDEDETA